MRQAGLTIGFQALTVSAVLLAIVAVSHAQQEPVLRLDEVIERRIEAAVVYLSVTFQKQESTDIFAESGTAFCVDEGILITNHHVIANALKARLARIEARVFSGSAESRVLPVDILKHDENLDLALLRLREPVAGLRPLPIATSTPGRQTEVFAFGFPLGTLLDHSTNGPNVSLRRGYVSRLLDDGKLIEADVNIDKGVSGGPLVDTTGVVLGVIRSLAGSDYNRMYAGIAITGPVVIEFCHTHGCRVTLHDGHVLEPQAPLPEPLVLGAEPEPRPRPELGEDRLRAFFALGASLRLSTLVPHYLVQQKAAYNEDILETSRTNMANLLAGLSRVGSPVELRREAEALVELLARGQTPPEQLVQRADNLEDHCNRWLAQGTQEERVNYELGAWLTELSVGLIAPDEDLPLAASFTQVALDRGAPPEIISLLESLIQNLNLLKQNDTPETRQSLRQQADRLLAIGLLAAGNGLGSAVKPRMPGPDDTGEDRNQIHLTIP